MITHEAVLRYNNCSHNIEKYFEIGTKWTKDDYCDNCLDSISDIEAEEETRDSLRLE